MLFYNFKYREKIVVERTYFSIEVYLDLYEKNSYHQGQDFSHFLRRELLFSITRTSNEEITFNFNISEFKLDEHLDESLYYNIEWLFSQVYRNLKPDNAENNLVLGKHFGTIYIGCSKENKLIHDKFDRGIKLPPVVISSSHDQINPTNIDTGKTLYEDVCYFFEKTQKGEIIEPSIRQYDGYEQMTIDDYVRENKLTVSTVR